MSLIFSTLILFMFYQLITILKKWNSGNLNTITQYNRQKAIIYLQT